MNTSSLFILILTPLLLFAGCNLTGGGENYDTEVQVGEKKLTVEVVNSDSERNQGLSGRSSLSDDNGMLFDFTNTNQTRPSFWMKDMKFDIDIIWIYNDRIVEITEGVPTTYTNVNLTTYAPSTDITHVLEVASGWAERHRVGVGDKIRY